MFTVLRRGPCRFSFLPRTYCFGPSFDQGDALAGFGSTASGPPKKSLRDFATLANLGHFALRSA